MSEWHIWTINQNRFKKVKEFLYEQVFVEDLLYPLVDKEYKGKKNKYTKKVPLYNNYIFIKYCETDEIPVIMKKCAWINSYIGKCTEQEINSMIEESVDTDVIKDDCVSHGAKVKLKNSGMHATVLHVDGNRVTVGMTMFGMDRTYTCCLDDVELID